jgi:hypothetical protein
MFKNLFKKKEIINYKDQLTEWERNGRPFPPPHIIKQMAIEEYKNKFHIEILVETGTYLGEMVEAQLNNFSRIISIELSKKIYKRAKQKFKNDPKVELLQGDSGKKLNEVVPLLKKPALFWLDGHYSHGMTAKGEKECPVPEELNTILKSSLPHIILIDDARLFNGTHDYPTIEQISEIIRSNNRQYLVEIKEDIIRLTPSHI